VISLSFALSAPEKKTTRKEKAMKTFVQTRITLLDALAQLRRLEGPERITQALHAVKERETGKLCYQAEEDLPHAELSLLKDMLRMEKETWEGYKQTWCHSVSEWIQKNDRVE
jgi:hypothetical protein